LFASVALGCLSHFPPSEAVVEIAAQVVIPVELDALPKGEVRPAGSKNGRHLHDSNSSWSEMQHVDVRVVMMVW
jgi:hypothetical protein